MLLVKRVPLAAALVLVAGLTIAACGGASGGGAGGAASAGAKTIAVTEKEFSITPKTITVPVGTHVVFAVTNKGTQPHTFEVVGYNKVTSLISPGQTVNLKLTASKAGTFETKCTIDSHADMGMKGQLIVK